MFVLIPYAVDVPRDRWPVVNWLIILATICVFVLQTPDLAEVYGQANPLVYHLAKVLPNMGTAGITHTLILTGWGLKGLFGHMWLHSGFFHLAGNMLFLWLFWDIIGALGGGDNQVAYAAHLGGFAAGFGLVWLLCQRGWITMERYEKSLLQAWREWRNPREEHPLGADLARLGPAPVNHEGPEPEVPSATTAEPGPIPLPEPAPVSARHDLPPGRSIRTVCACGADIRVSRQYAGKTIRCRTCGQRIAIPQKTDFFAPARQQPVALLPLTKPTSSPIIRFACPCGRKVKVAAKYAGRSGRCPQCGTRLRVPPATT